MLFKHEITPSQTRLRFDGKPDDAIRTLLKGAGFRWAPRAGCWWRRGCEGAVDFVLALDRRLNPGRTCGYASMERDGVI